MECVWDSAIPHFLNLHVRKHRTDIYYLDLIINVDGNPYSKHLTSYLRLVRTLSLTRTVSQEEG